MTHEQMMDYLYGEMSAIERKAFEQWLEENPAQKAELKDLQLTRKMLQSVEDIQPKPTTITLKRATIVPMRVIRWVSAAAAVGLLFWLSSPSLTFSNGGATLAFGRHSPSQQHTAVAIPNSQPEIKGMLVDYTQQVDAKIDSIYQQLYSTIEGQEQSVLANLEKELQGYSTQQQNQLLRVVDNRYQESMPKLLSNVQGMQLEQKQELRRMFSKLWNEWQKVREADKIEINRALEELRLEFELRQLQVGGKS